MDYVDRGVFFQKAPKDTGHVGKKGKSHLEITALLG